MSVWAHEDFESRGIRPEVAEARPYGRWTVSNREPVREAYQGLNRHQRAFMTRLAGKLPAYQQDLDSWLRKHPELSEADYGGWVINRHAPEGLEHVYAEIRPDKPIETGRPTKHWHGTAETKWHDHIAKNSKPDDHADKNTTREHSHKNAAKYIFPPAKRYEKPWEHDHAERYRTEEALAAHLRDEHSGEDIDGRHLHVSFMKDRDQSLARRLDLHPLAREKFPSAKRVFFAIEGCFKADSILSAGEAVFSVPSVTLWQAPELETFARGLAGRQIVIVPDADWSTNPKVVWHAMQARNYFRSLSLNACVAAPPIEIYEADHDIKGIDDYLGAGHLLTDLEVINVHPGSDPYMDMDERGWSKPRAKRNAAVLTAMSLAATLDGEICTSRKAVAKIMGTSHTRINDAVADLLEHEDVTVSGDYVTTEWNDWAGFEEWEDPPVWTINPEWRAVHTQETLGALG